MLPSWLTEPLWDQFQALLPERPEFHPDHPLGCHRRRIGDRIIFDKMLQLLRFGCSYEAIADTTCSATTIRDRRDEWIRLGVFARLKQIALESYDRIVGLVLDQIAVDGSITKAPGGGEAAGRSPVARGKQGLKRSGMTDGYGIPLGRVLAAANRHDSPLLAPTLDRLNEAAGSAAPFRTRPIRRATARSSALAAVGRRASTRPTTASAMRSSAGSTASRDIALSPRDTTSLPSAMRPLSS